MAYRRYRRKRPTRRARRTYTRRPRYGRRRRRVPDTLRCKRRVYQKVILTGNDVTSYGQGALIFKLEDLPNYGEFTNLYDRFRITGVKLIWRMTQDKATTAAYQGQKPTLVLARDYNDSVSWSTINDAMQYQKSKIITLSHDGNQQYTTSMFLKPAVSMSTYRVGVTNANSASWKAQVSTADYNTPFYGVKYAYERLYAGYSLECSAIYYIKFWNMI